MFTKENTINEIMADAITDRYLDLVFDRNMLSMVEDEFKAMPLEMVAVKCLMPWGCYFPANDFLAAVNLIPELISPQKYLLKPLWFEADGDYIPDMHSAAEDRVCLMSRKVSDDTVRPAVIVCPGGGYEMLSMYSEGFAMAERMEAAGYKAFVLIYRVSPNRWPLPQEDLALAIKHVRANAAQYHIQPDNIMVIGSSAGGHLCASTALRHEAVDAALMPDLEKKQPQLAKAYAGISGRPDKVCLCYPVISFLEEAHEPSFAALSGGDESLRELLSVEKHVDSTYPKTFVWACEDDDLVPVSNAVRLGEALTAAGADCCLRVYPTGGHGCGLAYHTSAKEWSDVMIKFMKK